MRAENTRAVLSHCQAGARASLILYNSKINLLIKGKLLYLEQEQLQVPQALAKSIPYGPIATMCEHIPVITKSSQFPREAGTCHLLKITGPALQTLSPGIALALSAELSEG